ncbi:unnamed protein product [Rotaria magnacalcarata]|uniref:EF-hand domain-containing protein n=1 Tax=Rotaria magnacalcarata TaxID=392030 RepID=A0A818Y9Y5_9BILA|nr:unnamed protein product [Rotaria magnacalcarata]CAF3748038.1 unnamed protein product [Rotaria magnacalcarata]
MNSIKTLGKNNILENRLRTSQQSNEFRMRSNNLRNWKSVSNIFSKKKLTSLDEIKCHLQKYFINHMSIVHQHCKKNTSIDKPTFQLMLRSSGILINNTCLESLWNSCQPSLQGISYEVFLQEFVPCQSENNHNSIVSSKDNLLSSKQCRILNYIALVTHAVKTYWENLKVEFCYLDPYGRLSIAIDQAMKIMKKFCFPLNDNQQRNLALLFSTKNNGQFNYFDFMQHFSNTSSLKSINQNSFSRSTYTIQSKQCWTCLPLTINCLLKRIRSQCIHYYGNIYRMFKVIDKNRQGYLDKSDFKRILKQFNIHLDAEEFYHVLSEIDQNQDGVISYDELYDALIIDALVI